MTSWVEVSEERLRANYEILLEAAGAGTVVLAVVKANAYGHGVERCARILADAGAEWLGVTGVEEGAMVRRALSAAGIAVEDQPRVLVMCGMVEEDAGAVVEWELTPVVWCGAQVRWLGEAARRSGLRTTIPVHVEVDSGMTRQGARPGAELQVLVRAIQAEKELRLDGVMTHFAAAEVTGAGCEQRKAFEAALMEIRKEGVTPAWVSAGNTSGVDLVEGPEDFVSWVRQLAESVHARPMVRTGLGLYGYSLPLELQLGGAGSSRLVGRLLPVMTWKTRVIGLEDVPAGAAVGYNGTFVVRRPTRLALVAAGYADGLRRELSSTNAKAGGWVMVGGQRTAIVGRVSMNLTSVDVTGIAGVGLGDEVVLLGEGITAEDHARIAGTIAYEILCGVRGAMI